MKILIIEDDKPVAHSLRAGLSQDYAVDLAYNGRKGLFKALTNEYDFIILDLNLPDTSGFQICQDLRREGLTLPILVLTGQQIPESKVVLLDAGADDYLVKPFNINEVKARLRALLRRTCWWTESNLLQIKPLKLNLKTQTAYCHERPLKLSKKEFLLLHFLMRHQNMPLSRLKLFEHVWEDQCSLTNNTVDVHICKLRRKLGPKSADMIQTVHGIGYMLVNQAEKDK